MILQQTSSMATPMGLAAAAVVDDVVDVVVAVFCCAGETVADAVIGDGVNSMTAVEGAAGSEHAKIIPLYSSLPHMYMIVFANIFTHPIFQL